MFAIDIALDRKRLWSQLRIDGSKPRRTLDWFHLIDCYADEARRLVEARAAYRFLGLDGALTLEPLAHTRFLEDATHVAVGALTLGPNLEARCNELAMAGDHPEASVLSMIGDAALIEGQGKVRRIMRAALPAPEWVLGPMLQPGASYWGLEANAVIGAHLPLDHLGMTVLDSCALKPLKSKIFVCPFAPAPRGDPSWNVA